MEEFSKLNVEGVACFLLNAYSNVLGEIDKLRKKLLSKKEQALIWKTLSKFSLQKMLNLGDSLLGKHPGEKAKGVSKQSFAEEIGQ